MALLREEIVAALRGQTLKLPNFADLNRGWPTIVSVHLPKLREEVSRRLREIISQRPNIASPEITIAKLIGADFALFAASWWPFESFDVLKVMVQMVIWLFLWDDEIDSYDGSYGNDLDPAQTYRDYTLKFVAQSLGIARAPTKMDVRAVEHSTNVLITSFQSIADAIAHRDEVQRARLYCEIEFFINATATEQQRRLYAEMPSIEEYMQCRMGTSAVYVLFALVEIPTAILEDTLLTNEMRNIEFETNVMISAANDMLSLKKELAAGTPDSLIPVLWQTSTSTDDAIDVAERMLYEARQRFDEAESRLRQVCPRASTSDIESFLSIAKTNCTGNIFWSMETQRYGLNNDVAEDGQIQITL